MYFNFTPGQQTCEKKELRGKGLEQRTVLHELEPVAVQVLHALVSLVHRQINVSDSGELVKSAPTTDSVRRVDVEITKAASGRLPGAQEDEIARILWSLEPCTLQDIFLAMAVNFYAFYFLVRL